MKEYSKMDCGELLAEILSEVESDSHLFPEVSYVRSMAREEFLKRSWSDCFRVLGEYISRLQGKSMKAHFLDNERGTIALLCLLYDLPESDECKMPYGRDVRYGIQDFGPWVTYCRMQENARSFKPLVVRR